MRKEKVPMHHTRLLRLLGLPMLLAAMTFAVIALSARTAAHTKEPAKPAAATPAPAPATPKATFVGSETCEGCHEASIKDHLATNFHGVALAKLEAENKGHLCEGCHGPGSAHVEDPGPDSGAPLKSMATSGAGCLSCHETKVASVRWRMSEHLKNGVTCEQCHMVAESPTLPKAKTPGAPTLATPPAAPDAHGVLTRIPSADRCLTCHQALRGQLALPSHHPIKEGVVTCTSCHNPHSPVDEKIKRDTCVTCHAKQHGPFVYEHDKAGGLTDGCVDCHRPHGSPNRKLLKLTGRGLCLQCHGDMVNHFPARNCLDCHKAVHGSNSNPLLFTK